VEPTTSQKHSTNNEIDISEGIEGTERIKSIKVNYNENENEIIDCAFYVASIWKY